MKRIFACSVSAVLLAFLLPVLLSVPGSGTSPAPEPPSATETPLPTEAPRAPVMDAGITVRLKTEAGVETMRLSEYLPLALAGEMPAAFPEEALKAQAVALRSYVLYYQGRPKDAHPDADVCTDPGCCAARGTVPALRETWGGKFDDYYAKLCAAVSDTDGQYLVWEDEPALAVFHASSAGRTESGAALGVDRAYLQSVETPETDEAVQNLTTRVEVGAEEFRRAVLTLTPEAELSGAPETWLGPVSLDEAGRVAAIEIGGARLSGLALRQLFFLRSTDFTLERTEDGFLFTVRGYGHGLGLSQHGAAVMARGGAGYGEILEHYYPGTRLVMALR